jgi:ribonuclease I
MDSRSSANFWAHEWNKHGTCALRQLPSEHAFFEAVLKLNARHDLRAALRTAGIVPSVSHAYPKHEVAAAIRNAHGVDALIHCDQHGQLTEVRSSCACMQAGDSRLPNSSPRLPLYVPAPPHFPSGVDVL